MKVHHGSTLIMIDSYFSPFPLFHFLPHITCFLFLLVTIYTYHYQSVKAILNLLGPLSAGRCFRLRRSPGDDLALFILKK